MIRGRIAIAAGLLSGISGLAVEPGPYAIEVEKLPAEVGGRVTAVDFSPDGRWMLLSHGGEVRARTAAGDAWELVSVSGLEGSSGLIARWWPKSLIVVHGAGISHLFDTDADGKVDFVKALAPVWRFGTSGVLFYGTPGVHDSGDLLMPPRVLKGPWAGTILRMPSEGAPSPWIAGLAKAAPPVSGPDGTWLVAGTSPLAGKEMGMVGLVMPPVSLEETPSAPKLESPEPTPAQVNGLEAGKPLKLADDVPEKVEVKKEGPAVPPASPPSAAVNPPAPPALALALRIPLELLTSATSIAFPPDSAKPEAFGPFSGQGFLAGDSSNRLLRFWLEEIDGAWQGGLTDFASIDSATPGLGFLRYTPDGSMLLAGQGGHLFGIRPAGGQLFSVRTIRLTADGGFDVTFTAPVDRAQAIDPTRWRVFEGDTAFPLNAESTRLIVSADGLSVSLMTGGWKAGQWYRFDFSGIASEAGEKVSHGPVWYTLNRLPPPPKAPPVFVPEEPAPTPASVPPAEVKPAP